MRKDVVICALVMCYYEGFFAASVFIVVVHRSTLGNWTSSDPGFEFFDSCSMRWCRMFNCLITKQSKTNHRESKTWFSIPKVDSHMRFFPHNTNNVAFNQSHSGIEIRSLHKTVRVSQQRSKSSYTSSSSQQTRFRPRPFMLGIPRCNSLQLNDRVYGTESSTRCWTSDKGVQSSSPREEWTIVHGSLTHRNMQMMLQCRGYRLDIR